MFSAMNWADIGIVAIILLSAAIGLFKELVQEVLSLLAWLLSLEIAILFLDQLANLLTTSVPALELRLGVAFLSLFFITFALILGINYLIVQSLAYQRISIAERAINMLLGATRGGIMITLMVILAGLTQLPTAKWWQESLFLQDFQRFALFFSQQLPTHTANQFNYAPGYKPKSS